MRSIQTNFDFQFTRFLQCVGLDLNEFTRPTREDIAHLRDGTLEGEMRWEDAMQGWDDPQYSPCYTRKCLSLARRIFSEALAGDEEAGIGLCTLLNRHRPHVAWGFFQLYLEDTITQRQFGRVLAFVYTSGNVFGPFRRVGYRLREIEQMFEMADACDVMTPDEYRTFLELPDHISIFRGTAGQTSKSVSYGMSWTRDRNVAAKFASWHEIDQHKPGQVWAGLVKRSDALAYFGNRNEDEVVVRPGRVYAVHAECQVELQDAA